MAYAQNLPSCDPLNSLTYKCSQRALYYSLNTSMCFMKTLFIGYILTWLSLFPAFFNYETDRHPVKTLYFIVNNPKIKVLSTRQIYLHPLFDFN